MSFRSTVFGAALLSITAAVAHAQSPSDLDPQSRARLPYVQRKDAGEDAKRLFDIFVRDSNSPTDTLGGPGEPRDAGADARRPAGPVEPGDVKIEVHGRPPDDDKIESTGYTCLDKACAVAVKAGGRKR